MKECCVSKRGKGAHRLIVVSRPNFQQRGALVPGTLVLGTQVPAQCPYPVPIPTTVPTTDLLPVPASLSPASLRNIRVFLQPSYSPSAIISYPRRLPASRSILTRGLRNGLESRDVAITRSLRRLIGCRW